MRCSRSPGQQAVVVWAKCPMYGHSTARCVPDRSAPANTASPSFFVPPIHASAACAMTAAWSISERCTPVAKTQSGQSATPSKRRASGKSEVSLSKKVPSHVDANISSAGGNKCSGRGGVLVMTTATKGGESPSGSCARCCGVELYSVLKSALACVVQQHKCVDVAQSHVRSYGVLAHEPMHVVEPESEACEGWTQQHAQEQVKRATAQILQQNKRWGRALGSEHKHVRTQSRCRA